jgi:hypothetical protein
MKKPKMFRIIWVAVACLLFGSPALAELQWTLEEAIPLGTEVLDVAEATDGKRLFVLTGEGSILVVDRKGKVEATIPGPFAADRLHVSKDGKQLFLAGKGQKSLQVVSLEDRFLIDVSGSPFKGDAAAAVAVVVFSDFQ